MRDVRPDLTTAHDQRTALAELADPRYTAVLVVDEQNIFVGFSLHHPVEEVTADQDACYVHPIAV